MGTKADGFYGSSYYAQQAGGALQSAGVVLRVLFEIYRPKSMFDLGCGQGAWLAAAEMLGVEKLVGMDGPWVDPGALMSKTIQFSAVDLEKEFTIPGKFDLSISVEVAEHVSAGRSRAIVSALCGASDVVIFGAAIPQQGGVNHINEQWQSFWAALFETEGFECYDIFRRKLWDSGTVDSWYRQNVLLYLRRGHPLTEQLRSVSATGGHLDIVHPDIFSGNLENSGRPLERPSLSFCGRIFARWLSNKFHGAKRSQGG